MICPACKTEYREGTKTCSACRLDLVAQPPEVPEAELSARAIPFSAEEAAAVAELPANWDSANVSVEAWAGSDPGRLQFIEHSLHGVGVATIRIAGEEGVVRLLIRPEDEERGREVVRQILNNAVPQQPLPGTKEYVWLDEPVKSYSLIWALAGAFLLLCFIGLSVPGLSFGATALLTGVVGLATLVANIGALWMLYQSIRYELRPLLFCVLSIIPFSFVWYYYERYTKRQGVRRLPVAIRTRVSPPPSA
jgi:hypothetical protein